MNGKKLVDVEVFLGVFFCSGPHPAAAFDLLRLSWFGNEGKVLLFQSLVSFGI